MCGLLFFRLALEMIADESSKWSDECLKNQRMKPKKVMRRPIAVRTKVPPYINKFSMRLNPDSALFSSLSKRS